MADPVPDAVPAPAPRTGLRLWLVRLAKFVTGALLGLALALAAFMVFLDTGAGHRFIVDRIAAMTPESGLRIRIGRIDGSIWGRTQLRDVRLYDPQGLFAESSRIEMEWRPIDFLWNSLVIHELDSDLVILHRLPELSPPEEPRPLLPSFDLHLGRLEVRQLRIGARVTGRERIGSLRGEAAIRRGRALLALDIAMRDGGDRLRINLDAQPEADRFDMDARIRAPANSVVGAMLGTRRPVRLDLEGEGRYARWDGTALLDISGRRTADLRLRMENGRFRLQGWAAPAPFLRGKLQRLTSPRVNLSGSGLFEDRIVDARLSARSPAIRLEARGRFDLRRNAYDGVQIAADLTHPPAMFRNMTGRQIRFAALLDGPAGRARFAYRLTSPRIAFDNTAFEEVRAQGAGNLSRAPVTVPLAASARRVTGNGDVAAGILAELRVNGALRVTPQRLRADDLVVTSRWLRGLGDVEVDLRTGVYEATFNGGMRDYPIPGFGTVDVLTELRAVPGPNRRGTIVTGGARSWVKRLDNRFLEWVTGSSCPPGTTGGCGAASTRSPGGLPRLETNLRRGPDRIVHFSNLRITAPKLSLAGAGLRRTDGTFSFEGAGRHGDYGPLRLSLDGRLERPRLTVRLDRPLDSLGLRDVLLSIDPNEAGFAWRGEGGSALGPFTGNGQILLPRGGPTTIQFAQLNVSGTRASGALRADPGGFSGQLDVAGGGLDGRLLFSPHRGHQRIAVRLTANDARFAGPPPIVVRRGTIEGVVLLDPGGTSIEGRVTARGLSRGPLSIANLEASASLRGGRGTVRARVAGSRGRDFSFDAVAEVAPGRYRVSGSGTLDRRPLELVTPAELIWQAEGWRLAPTRFRYGGGNASLSGLFGTRTEIDARLEAMPLTVLDIFYPRLGLGGIASGRVRYASSSADAPPSGEADLRVRGLSRAGLVLSSRPVDIGLNARLSGSGAAFRAIAVSEGRTTGRAQGRLSGIGGPGSVGERLARAPMRAQIRYNGAADTLWRLTGIELIDLSGPAAISADMSGSFNEPIINGSVRTAAARLESAVTGMVIDSLEAEGRFGGSELRFTRFRGRTEGGGTISGTGALDFSVARGVGMRFDLAAANARLLDRDDIQASVSGDLAIRSDGEGGSISGNVTLTEGRFQLGSATAAGRVARLNAREVNRPDSELGPAPRRIAPWRLALGVRAPNRLRVTGLGMNSEWRADLDVRGTVTEPRISGEAGLIRGTYDFAGRRFDLVRGNIRFQGESPVNPLLDIAAEARVRGLSAQIRVTGRSQRPEIAFTSTPALPQDELLSRILFGTSITNLSAPEAVQLASAIAGLNDPGGGLDPINAIRRSVGLDRLRVLPADVTQGIGTQLAAGKYLGRRVYVEVVTDGRGYSATTVEYQITRWLSLLSSISTIGRESVNLRVSRDY